MLIQVDNMGGCIGINRTTDTETVNGSSTNISRPASGNIIYGNCVNQKGFPYY